MFFKNDRKSWLRFVGYFVTVAVGFLLYVLMREYLFTKLNDTGSLENELKLVSSKLPISDEKKHVTIESLIADEEYNLIFDIAISSKWEHFPSKASKEYILRKLHESDGRVDSSVLCHQTLVRLAIGQGGVVWVNYSVPDVGIHKEKVRIECSPLER